MQEVHADQQGEPRPGRSLLRVAPLLVLLLVVVAGASALLFSRSSGSALPGGAHQAPPGGGWWGTLALPARQAPALALRDSEGRETTLAQFRGRPVLVTFLYVHCPDVCPLITANLHEALRRLGPEASRVAVLAVSVDPRGDTPQAVAHFLAAHEMTGRMRYLLGSPAALARTWRAWGVGAQNETADPGLVAHSALVYGVGASGRLLTIYPASFDPAQISHDVPRLAAH